MPAFSPAVSAQNQSGFNRPNSFGENLEKKTEVNANSDTTQQQLKDNNSAWTTFLRVPDASPNQTVSFTRLDTITADIAEEKPAISFEEIFGRITRQDVESTHEQLGHTALAGSIRFEQKQTVEVEIGESTKESSEKMAMTSETKEVSVKKNLLGTAEKTAEVTTKIAKRGYKEAKEVFGAVKDLLTNFIFFREKKADPNAKANAEKLAKRRANKARFIGMLREGISLYYAGMRRALMELEVKLGTNVLRTEDKNRLLGRNRNASFEGNDSVYAITQTAYAMVEQKRRQQESQKSIPTARGKASRGQIFTDKNLSGERSGGNNMMSAVG